MRANVYRGEDARDQGSARYFGVSLLDLLLIAVAACGLGTLLALLRWPF